VTQGTTPALAPSHYDNTGHVMPRGISDHGPQSAALGRALPAHGLRSLPAARHSPSACHDLDAAPPLPARRASPLAPPGGAPRSRPAGSGADAGTQRLRGMEHIPHRPSEGKALADTGITLHACCGGSHAPRMHALGR
jgi:hypothetical protein